jgi:hypothetical protein
MDTNETEEEATFDILQGPSAIKMLTAALLLIEGGGRPSDRNKVTLQFTVEGRKRRQSFRINVIIDEDFKLFDELYTITGSLQRNGGSVQVKYRLKPMNGKYGSLTVVRTRS